MSKPPKGYRPGAGAIVLNAAGLVFVAERLDAPGAWQMPQGGLDAGEDPRAGALRELAEETGIRSVAMLAQTKEWLRYDFPPNFETRWGKKYRGQAQHWLLLRFTGRESEINLAQEHPEFGAWRWVDARTLPDLTISWKRPLYEALLTEFGPLIGPSQG